MDKYKETYPQEIYELIVNYAQKYSELSQTPLLQVLREQTPIYFFIGNYNWNYDFNSKYSKEFEDRIKTEDIANVAFDMQNNYYKRLTKEEDWFGCFKYKHKKDNKTGYELIKIHFRNFDKTVLGPLAHENTQLRINELTQMFSEIKQKYPLVKHVQGGSWLYNYKSYRRLFPDSFTLDMRKISPQTHYMIIWGQFIDSEKKIAEERRAYFLDKLNRVSKLEKLESVFPFMEFLPKGDITEFFKMYSIN